MTTLAEDHVIIYNIAYMWQTEFKYMVGTVLHELVHVAHYGARDNNLQKALGIPQDASNTANISVKLANDCFANVTAP